MSTLDLIINYTNIYQDVELAAAINELKNGPANELNAFLSAQQGKVYDSIKRQKDNTFQKVYGDLEKSTQVQDSILRYDNRTQELSNIQNQIYENQKNSAYAVSEDKNMAGRKSEMNEWSVNNKKDTLFVFSSLFIMLSGLLLITVLWRMGLMSSYLWGALGAPLIIIFILIVINRSQYTDILRNKRYWNKKIFEGKYGKIPIPLCPGMIDGIQNGINAATDAASKGLVSTSQAVAAGAGTVASAASTLAVSANAPVVPKA